MSGQMDFSEISVEDIALTEHSAADEMGSPHTVLDDSNPFLHAADRNHLKE